MARIRNLFGGLTLCTIILVVFFASWSLCPCLAGDKSGPSGKRQLVISDKFSLGRVYVYEAPPDDRGRVRIYRINDSNRAHFIGEAKGTLTVPEGKNVRLYFEPSYDLVEHPQALKSLPPDSFDCIAFVGTAIMAQVTNTFPALSHLTGLRRLEIDGAELTDEQLLPLKPLVNLEVVCLRGNALKGSCFKDLSTWTNLRDLDASFNPFESDAYQYIAQFKKLERLHIDQCKISDKGLEILAEHLPNLRDLSIVQSTLTAKGLTSLKSLKHLYLLDLCGTHLPIKDLTILNGSSVGEIKVSDNIYSKTEIQQIKNALPKIIVSVPSRPKLTDEDKVYFAPLH